MRTYLMPLGTAVLWGLNYHFAKRMVGEASFAEAGFWRYAIAVAVLALAGARSLPPWRKVRRAVPSVLRIGSLALFGFNLGYFLGLRTTSALNASLIMALNPATTVVLSSVWLGTRIVPVHVVGLMVSLAGVAYLIFDGSPSAALALDVNGGDAFILGANLCFAVHHVLVKRDGGALPNAPFTWLVNVACLLSFVLLATVLAEPPSLRHSGGFWGAALGFGALGTALAYLLWNAGVARLGADTSALFLNVAPLATAAGAVVLGEPLEGRHFVSGALVLGGLLLSQLPVLRSRALAAAVSRAPPSPPGGDSGR